MIPTERI